MSTTAAKAQVTYRWRLRLVMAERGMFATSDLAPLLAERGVVLSREQIYRMVAKTPERVSLATLAVLCDILECDPTELIEIVRAPTPERPPASGTRGVAVRALRPVRARVDPGAT